MSTRTRAAVVRTAAVAAAAGATMVFGAAAQASAEVAPGTYTSTTTLSTGSVVLQRVGHVEGQDLVLIGRYPIHPTPTGGYVDFFPGHRVVFNSDGHGGYSGAAYLGGIVVGTGTLTPLG